jgi:drug/metabolite transporter (DMT)-like permease
MPHFLRPFCLLYALFFIISAVLLFRDKPGPWTKVGVLLGACLSIIALYAVWIRLQLGETAKSASFDYLLTRQN